MAHPPVGIGAIAGGMDCGFFADVSGLTEEDPGMALQNTTVQTALKRIAR